MAVAENRWGTPDGKRPKLKEFDLVWDTAKSLIFVVRLCCECKKGLFLLWDRPIVKEKKRELRCKACSETP